MKIRPVRNANPTMRFRDWLRSAFVVIVSVGGAVYFCSVADKFYPLREWLFFRYARVWLHAAIFSAACLSSGWALGRVLIKERILPAERLVLSSALGVFGFFVGIFVAGCLNLYGSGLFLGWPCLLLLVGGAYLLHERAHRHAPEPWPSVASLMPRSAIELVAAVFLLLGVVTIYLQVMLPRNLGSDSYWYHLPIAEGYVAAGGIRRFAEGWYIGAYPQLASFLYVWAFLSPGALVDHVLLCMHLEFVLFLVTLAALSVLVARLVGITRVPYAAAAIFLFPKLFIYDSNLNGGADHVLAFWCAILPLALMLLAKRFQAHTAATAALMVAGAALTKYQALFAIVPTALLLIGLGIKYRRMQPLWVFGTVVLVATMPHWIKNWIFYHDPLYPFLHRYLPSTPYHPGAEALAKEVFWPGQFDNSGDLKAQLLAVAKALLTFSFVPNDWGFHGDRPEFGSLLTLLLPVLLVVRAPRRLWVTVVGVHIGIATWYAVNHQDRFLQCLVPAMASVVAATLWLAWKRGTVVRIAVSGLVVMQVIWGLDAAFIPGHTMIGESPLHELGSYLAAGYNGKYQERLQLPGSYAFFASHLPKGAKLLLHRLNTRLGLGAAAVNDEPGLQGGIDYVLLDTPAASAELLRQYGVTHATWFAERPSMSPSIVAREAVFTRVASQYFSPNFRINEYRFGEFRAQPMNANEARLPTKIAWLDCHGEVPIGIYSPHGLVKRQRERAFVSALTPETVRELLAPANVVVLSKGCESEQRTFDSVKADFIATEVYGDRTLWLRPRSLAADH